LSLGEIKYWLNHDNILINFHTARTAKSLPNLDVVHVEQSGLMLDLLDGAECLDRVVMRLDLYGMLGSLAKHYPAVLVMFPFFVLLVALYIQFTYWIREGVRMTYPLLISERIMGVTDAVYTLLRVRSFVWTAVLSATLWILDSHDWQSSWFGVEHSWFIIPFGMWWGMGTALVFSWLNTTIIDVLSLLTRLIKAIILRRPDSSRYVCRVVQSRQETEKRHGAQSGCTRCVASLGQPIRSLSIRIHGRICSHAFHVYSHAT
jgi:hypothetical protein